jgi:putative heme-binding domain-containing protein
MAREYQPMIVLTSEGQTLTGLLRAENTDSVRIQTATEELTLYREDIEQMKQSELSMMPADLLSPLSETETRDLIAYLRSDRTEN